MTTLAAIDLGSNAARLLIWRDGTVVERRSTISRLGEGLERTGELGPAGRGQTLAALDAYASLLERHRVEQVRIVATAAVRAAANRDDLLTAVEARLGVRPDVLSAQDEARYGYRGALAGASVEGPAFLVVDIGGGSTELAFGQERPQPDSVVTMDLGSASLTAAELPSDPPRPEELSNAIAIAHDHVDEALRALPGIEDGLVPPTIVGLGGTIVTVAAVEIGVPLPPGDAALQGRVDVVEPLLHGLFLTRDAAEDVFRTLAQEPLADRVHNPGLPPARAPIIVGGCCILVSLLRRLRVRGLSVSLCDLLDAVVAELAVSRPASPPTGS